MQTKKTIIIAITVLLAVVALFFWYLIYREKSTKNQDINQITISKNEKKKQINTAVNNLTKDQKKKVANTKNQKATLKSVDIGKVVIVLTEGMNEEISLSVPEQGATFVSQTKQEDGSFMNKEIGLFELPLNEEVEVQYDSIDKELIMVTVSN